MTVNAPTVRLTCDGEGCSTTVSCFSYAGFQNGLLPPGWATRVDYIGLTSVSRIRHLCCFCTLENRRKEIESRAAHLSNLIDLGGSLESIVKEVGSFQEFVTAWLGRTKKGLQAKEGNAVMVEGGDD